MRIKISADSTCDLSPELIETYNIGITPLYIEKGGQNCRDGMDITPQEIFDYVRSGKGVCRTAAVNVGDYTAFFKKCRENYDAVIHFNISSDFSSCYQNACTAAAEFENVYVVDSRNLSTGIALLVMVILLPMLGTNQLGMGDPFFCKYLCPQGVLEGAIPLSLTNAGIRAALGKLFSWKLGILLAVVVASVVFYRPFCKWLCPLGAFYAVMNRVSLFQMRVDTDKCVSCGACARACKMDVDITKTPNHAECIRCGMCIKSCPTKAIHYQYGFGDKADNSKEI